ncbi:MAG: hypothetical protein Alpg2KO_16800 [Alphaproteobacteria bacterium]
MLATALPKAFPMQEATALIRRAKGEHGNRHSHMFEDGEWRRYYPMPKPQAEHLGRTARHIKRVLDNMGFTDIDYIAGTCVDDRKQTRRIGRVLKDDHWKQQFANDPDRQGGNLVMVISRHPYDLIRMSTGRGWQSCMTRGGSYSDYLPKEVAEGSMVAYLISPNDPEILDPMSRVTVKPYRNAQGQTIMRAGPTYGMGSGLFRQAVQSVLEREYNAGIYGDFRMPGNVYDDCMDITQRRRPDNLQDWSAEQLATYLGLEIAEEEGRKIIRGDINLVGHDITQLPDLSDYELEGNLLVYGNRLTSLKGAPHKITGSCRALNNRITSLEGGPQWVGEDFNVSSNRLADLTGGPAHVGQHYSAFKNGLTSMAGLPDQIHGNLDIRANKLADFKGAPRLVKGALDLSSNQYTDLKGIPQIGTEQDGGGGLNLRFNQLTSLEGLEHKLVHGDLDITKLIYLKNLKGCPRILRGSLKSEDNHLTSLEGAPDRVDGNFNVTNNHLTSLRGAPQVISGKFIASKNNLDSLAGLPANAGKGIELKHCQLHHLKGMPREITSHLDLTHNHLKSLEGMPERVGGDLSLSDNTFRNLEGMPRVIGGSLIARDCGLQSTKGIAQHIGGTINLQKNSICDLEDLPRRINGDLILRGNGLRTTKGLPQEIKGDLDLFDNLIEDATIMPRRVEGTIELRVNCHLKHLPAKMPEGVDFLYAERATLTADHLPYDRYPPKGPDRPTTAFGKAAGGL